MAVFDGRAGCGGGRGEGLLRTTRRSIRRLDLLRDVDDAKGMIPASPGQVAGGIFRAEEDIGDDLDRAVFVRFRGAGVEDRRKPSWEGRR